MGLFLLYAACLAGHLGAQTTVNGQEIQKQTFTLKLPLNSVYDRVESDGTRYALVYHVNGSSDRNLITDEGSYTLRSDLQWESGQDPIFAFAKDGKEFIRYKGQNLGPYDKVQLFSEKDKQGAAVLSDGTWSLGYIGEAPLISGIQAKGKAAWYNWGKFQGFLSDDDPSAKVYGLDGSVKTMPFSLSNYKKRTILANGDVLFSYQTTTDDPTLTLGLWDGAAIAATWPLDRKGSFELFEEHGREILIVSPVYDGTDFNPPYTVIDLASKTILARPSVQPENIKATMDGSVCFTVKTAAMDEYHVGSLAVPFAPEIATATWIASEEENLVWGFMLPRTMKDKQGKSLRGYDAYYAGKPVAFVKEYQEGSLKTTQGGIVVFKDFNNQSVVYKGGKLALTLSSGDMIAESVAPDSETLYFIVMGNKGFSIYKNFKLLAGPFVNIASAKFMADGSLLFVATGNTGDTIYKNGKPYSKEAKRAAYLLSQDKSHVYHWELRNGKAAIFKDGADLIPNIPCSDISLLGELSNGSLAWIKEADINGAPQRVLMRDRQTIALLLNHGYFDEERELMEFTDESRDAFKTLDGSVYRGRAVLPLSPKGEAASKEDPEDGNNALGAAGGQPIYEENARILWGRPNRRGTQVVGVKDQFIGIIGSDENGRSQIRWNGANGLVDEIWGIDGFPNRYPGTAITRDGKIVGWAFVLGLQDNGNHAYIGGGDYEMYLVTFSAHDASSIVNFSWK